ncbi:hypothetical protein KIW84_041388 [Lathyrus oleraceus]|uniref:Uncharacterized protein n=1 Tax=Pisum sativum TaxID=3888 RepID=A0A9D4XA21_PEA|nr:hypothetical protein KIW84_041388 [Pisum sativum]
MLKKLKKVNIMTILKEHNIDEDEMILPNPFQAAIASAIAFSFDATVPLLGAAMVFKYEATKDKILGCVHEKRNGVVTLNTTKNYSANP